MQLRYSNPPRSSRSAFSLVELLAVIAIIAVLAGIVMTATSRVRASARKATCIQNLRELFTGFQLYTHDKKKYPVAYSATQNWRNLLVQNGYVGSATTGATSTTAALIAANFSVMRCPEAMAQSATGANSSSYAMNGYLSDVPPVRVAAPSYCMLVADARKEVSGAFNPAIWKGDAPSAIHGGQTNILFCDGHVESRLTGEIPVNVGTSGFTSSEVARFWN